MPRAATREGTVNPLPAAPGAGDYLGPARVTEVAASAVTVELPGGASARATMALAFPYRPAVGDTLLVVSRGAAHYVIGVLQGTGETVLSLPGGVTLRAEGGPLHLASDQAVTLEAPEVGVDARRLRLLAESAVEKVGTLYQHVRGLFRSRAGEREDVVDESAITRAKSATILTEESMSINGKQINLG